MVRVVNLIHAWGNSLVEKQCTYETDKNPDFEKSSFLKIVFLCKGIAG